MRTIPLFGALPLRNIEDFFFAIHTIEVFNSWEFFVFNGRILSSTKTISTSCELVPICVKSKMAMPTHEAVEDTVLVHPLVVVYCESAVIAVDKFYKRWRSECGANAPMYSASRYAGYRVGFFPRTVDKIIGECNNPYSRRWQEILSHA